jgi:hypothetical protein
MLYAQYLIEVVYLFPYAQYLIEVVYVFPYAQYLIKVVYVFPSWFQFSYMYQNIKWFCARCLEPISSQLLPSHHDALQAMIRGAESRLEVQRAPER